MNSTIKLLCTVLVAGILVGGCASIGGNGNAENHRTFHASGGIDYGRTDQSYNADLIIHVADDQFLVMKELIQDFQKANPYISTVYVENILPGRIPNKQTADLFTTVDMELLHILKERGRMESHMIYARNQLALMVAKGNPKNIAGPQDLARDDLVQSHPNPVNETVFRIYGSQMLKDLGLYDKVTDGAQCKRCWAVEDKTWFTENHYLEIPMRIENGEADVGIVWASEVVDAQLRGQAVEGVSIPEPYNQADKMAYVIGILSDGKNRANAELFLSYLRTRRAQQIYSDYGYVSATEGELEIRPL